jgi:copper chaperone CopZ
VSFCCGAETGRVRLRFRELKDAAVAAAAETRIKATAGITSVEVNSKTGSLLIEYDPRLLPTEKLIESGRQELAHFGITLDG